MMKTLKLQRNLFYSLVITVILISCQKDKDHADESGKQSTETKTKVPPTRDISMMRSALDDLYSHEKIAAYHTLSDSAKYTYWYFRITDYLEGDFRPGNQDQTDALLELRDSLSYRLYSDTAVRDAFKTNFLNDWIADNTVLLDVHLIRAGDLLSDPEAESDIAGKYAPDFPDLGGNNCVCNIGSGYACKKLVVNTTFPYSTYWVYGACSVGTVCTTVTYGCGFWALWSCNGNLCTYS